MDEQRHALRAHRQGFLLVVPGNDGYFGIGSAAVKTRF
jgi:hypothetical protein